MAAEGVQTFAEMRERHFTILARHAAASPVPYGTSLPALHAATAGGGVRVLVRLDSAGDDALALCGLAAGSAGMAAIHWIALSGHVAPCLGEAAAERMSAASPAAAAELGGSRWMVMDAGGRALYSRGEVPSPEHLRRIVALLAGNAEAGR